MLKYILLCLCMSNNFHEYKTQKRSHSKPWWQEKRHHWSSRLYIIQWHSPEINIQPKSIVLEYMAKYTHCMHRVNKYSMKFMWDSRICMTVIIYCIHWVSRNHSYVTVSPSVCSHHPYMSYSKVQYWVSNICWVKYNIFQISCMTNICCQSKVKHYFCSSPHLGQVEIICA